MCGIAGFNCRPDLLKNRSEDWAKEVTITGLLMNEIRGTDAAGWMATYRTEDRPSPDESEHTLWYNKHGETPTEFVSNGSFPLGFPVGLAVHTRDYTRGTPKENKNNHPVMFNNILVTHNGGIDNYLTIINDAKLTPAAKANLGDVDSVAIPVFFRNITKPSEELEELDIIIQSLHTMRGKYTFHAMWGYDPGVSLIVAGPDRPMWYMFNEALGLHVYSSEKEGARAIYNKFTKDKKTLREGELEQGTAILIKEGEVLRKWEFELPPATSYGYTYKEPTMERLSVFDIDLKNDASGHWTKDDAPISLDEAKDFVGAKLFCLQSKEGVAKQYHDADINKAVWARPYTKTWVGWEADEVWVSIPNFELHNKANIGWTSFKIRFFTVYKDTTEIVWDNHFKFLDVYNWEHQIVGYPWRMLPKAAPNPKTKVIDLTNKTWFNRRLNKQAPIAEKQVKAREEKKKTLTIVQTNKTRAQEIFDAFYDEYFIPHELEDMVFLQNKFCTVHKVLYNIHPKPLECAQAVEAAWDMLSMTTDLDDAKDIYDFAVFQTRGKGACPDAGLDHVWENCAKNQVVVRFDRSPTETIEYEVTYPVGEKCARPNCELRRFWTNPPYFGMTVAPVRPEKVDA